MTTDHASPTPRVRFKVWRGRDGQPRVRHIVYRPSLRMTVAAPWLRLRYGRRAGRVAAPA